MEQSGPKIIGRFIKKGAKILDSISLQSFTFGDLSSRAVIEHDNTKNNIIHARLHETDELEKAVRHHKKMNQDLRNPDSIRPILQPLDFTEDWERQRARAARGNSSRMEDDEDEFELEIEFQEKKAAAAKAAKGPKKDGHEEDHESDETHEPESSEAQTSMATQSDSDLGKELLKPIEDSLKQLSTKEQKPVSRFTQQRENLNQIGKVIMQDGGEEPVAKPTIAFKSEPAPAANAASERDPANLDTTAPLEAQQASDSFIPVTAGASDSVQEPEKAAIQEYKDRNDQAARAQAEKQEFESAKSLGYQEGFKQGEEKAALQLKNATQQVIGDISKLIGELESLKKTVLTNVQENFYEVCQAMGESLLQREFKIDPTAFASVIKRAISDTIDDTKLKIAVHPEFFNKLNALKLEEFSGLLVADENVTPGDFRIDSNLTVVDGNTRKLIKDLLDQADINLFDQKDKAS